MVKSQAFENVLSGHPDRICDDIAETIFETLFEIDGWKVRTAFELMYTNKTLIVSGEVKTSLSNEKLKELVNYIIQDIYNLKNLEILHIWQSQSNEIFKASLEGFGDNTIAFGYAEQRDGKIVNIPQKQNDVNQISQILENISIVDKPDGKVLIIETNGKRIIQASIQKPFDDKHIKQFEKKVNDYYRSKQILNKFRFSLFDKSGSVADTGLTGRKLIAENKGAGLPHGGGAISGKDFTKGDKSLKIISDYLASKYLKFLIDSGKEIYDVLVQSAVCFGDKEVYFEIYNDKLTLVDFKKWLVLNWKMDNWKEELVRIYKTKTKANKWAKIKNYINEKKLSS